MKGDDWTPHGEEEDEFSAALHQRTEELYRIPNSEIDDEGLITCAVLTMRDLVVFPRMISPIFITPGPNLLAIQDAQYNFHDGDRASPARSGPRNPIPDDFLPVGVEMAVGRLLSMPDGNNSALVQGRRRFEIVEFAQLDPFYIVKPAWWKNPGDVDRHTDALMRTARDLFERCVQLDRSLPEEAHLFSIEYSRAGLAVGYDRNGDLAALQRAPVTASAAGPNRTV